MEQLTSKALRLCLLHRKMRPIKKLFVCLLGDIVENMNVPIPKLEELEKEHIQRVLRKAESLEKAAEILGIDTTTLYRKRKKLNLA